MSDIGMDISGLDETKTSDLITLIVDADSMLAEIKRRSPGADIGVNRERFVAVSTEFIEAVMLEIDARIPPRRR